ncbi:MAG TPA: nucleoside diphosphate kinase regulator [Bacteriovoracaceae bacterium]|nr:nucleoside diphosphate kinase regulator [Bacteriovoracaceae bacterium]
MNNEDKIYVTEKDFMRLKNLLDSYDGDEFEDLEIELDRAGVLSDEEVPKDLITMNSQVRYLNVQDNKESVVTLVYPKDANSSEGKISILAPLGSALIGLKVGQEINWMFPDGKTRTLRILEVVYQPESSGDWHL